MAERIPCVSPETYMTQGSQHVPSAPPHCTATGEHCAQIMVMVPMDIKEYAIESTHIAALCPWFGLTILTSKDENGELGDSERQDT